MLQTILSYWWVVLLALVALDMLTKRLILRVFFGMIIVPEDKIGLVTKKFVLIGANKSLPDGKIIALNGEPGYQADTLSPGLKWGFWPWQFQIDFSPLTIIPKGKIGLVTAKDGASLPTGSILARHVACDDYQNSRAFLTNGGKRGKQVGYINNGVYRINPFLFEVTQTDIVNIEDGKIGIITTLDGEPLDSGNIAGKEITSGHNNYQDFDKFLEAGGQRGLQIKPIQAGNYSLNPWAVQVEKVDMTVVPIGHVGVVISYVGAEGKDVTGDNFKHGNLVSKGQKGVLEIPYDPGKYAINPYTTKIEIVQTTNLVLNWATGTNASHKLDEHLSTIKVRSKDGFSFTLDVSQIIHIPALDAPKVIARFGSLLNLVQQVLEPTVGNYFRNSAQESDIISFLSDRKTRQDEARKAISSVLVEYNVQAVDTLIGDIVPPEELMKTLTDRKIAQEQETTYKVECIAQDQRKILASATALADMQPQMVQAQQSVEISQRNAEAEVKRSEGEAKAIEIKAKATAEATKLTAGAEANRIELTGKAEATKIEAIGKATADAYEQQVKAMGPENFAKFKIIEEVGKNNIKLIPEILITGGGDGNNSLTGLATIEMLNYVKNNPAASANTASPTTAKKS